MSQIDLKAFQPLTNSTAPAFNSSALGATSHVYALESTGLREYQYPSNRSVRLMASTADRYYVNFGNSGIVAASSNSMLVRNGDIPQVFSVQTGQSHIAFVSSTTITINITLGMGQ